MVKIIVRLIVSAIAAVVLVSPATASATPTGEVVSVVQEVGLPAWDTLENRTVGGAVIGAVIGGLAGLPFFGVGAIPGAIIGAVIGAAIGQGTWHLAQQYFN